MDALPISETLPGLYRAVLDAVANLEARDRRREAAEIRADATRAYSRAWNAAAEKRLRALRLRADRILDMRHPGRPELAAETFGRQADMGRKTA